MSPNKPEESATERSGEGGATEGRGVGPAGDKQRTRVRRVVWIPFAGELVVWGLCIANVSWMYDWLDSSQLSLAVTVAIAALTFTPMELKYVKARVSGKVRRWFRIWIVWF